MELYVVFAVILAAALHAGWNAAVKIGSDRLIAVTLVSSFSGAIGAAAIPFVGVPGLQALHWLAASVLLHTAYKLFLARAYHAGDLGQVYPLARGVAPLLVTFAGLVALGEHITLLSLLGIVTLSVGIISMAFRGSDPSVAAPLGRQAIFLALVTSFFIAGYSLVDGAGARVAQSPHAYAAWLFFLDGIAIWFFTAWKRGPDLGAAVRSHWRVALGAGAMSAGSYWIAVWAMTQAPIALVAALRESSVLFATLISVFLLRERLMLWRILGSILIISGIAAITLR